MPALPNFHQFDGRYWDTGVIRNALDYQGARNPITQEPYTEALLLGISGGITFGYFTFHYDGYDPQVNLLTRNTFEPMATILERLAVPREVRQSTLPEKARQTLVTALENGEAPIVWADMYSLPYNALVAPPMWAMMPVLVFDYTPQGTAQLSDRALVPLPVTAEALDAARARTKQERHRLMTLGSPDAARLPAAVRQGILDGIALMTEKPPRGSVKNFGLRALQHWADALVKTGKGTWAADYPTGRRLLAVLLSAYTFLGTGFGKTRQAERDLYADFLEEAAAVLGNPALDNVAARYRVAGRAWDGLMCALLPEDVPMLKLARQHLDMRAEAFMEGGAATTEERLRLGAALDALKREAETDFPLSLAEVADLRDEIRRHVLRVHDAEAEAVMALKAAMERV